MCNHPYPLFGVPLTANALMDIPHHPVPMPNAISDVTSHAKHVQALPILNVHHVTMELNCHQANVC